MDAVICAEIFLGDGNMFGQVEIFSYRCLKTMKIWEGVYIKLVII